MLGDRHVILIHEDVHSQPGGVVECCVQYMASWHGIRLVNVVYHFSTLLFQHILPS